MEFAFYVTFDMCESNLRSSEMVRPRYGLLLTRSSVALFKPFFYTEYVTFVCVEAYP